MPAGAVGAGAGPATGNRAGPTARRRAAGPGLSPRGPVVGHRRRHDRRPGTGAGGRGGERGRRGLGRGRAQEEEQEPAGPGPRPARPDRTCGRRRCPPAAAGGAALGAVRPGPPRRRSAPASRRCGRPAPLRSARLWLWLRLRSPPPRSGSAPPRRGSRRGQEVGRRRRALPCGRAAPGRGAAEGGGGGGGWRRRRWLVAPGPARGSRRAGGERRAGHAIRLAPMFHWGKWKKRMGASASSSKRPVFDEREDGECGPGCPAPGCPCPAMPLPRTC